jgi:hypothetical protein
MATYSVAVAGDVENAQVKLDMFAHTLENGEALVTPIPKGFPAAAMPEVATRVAFMLRQYVDVYAAKEPEKEAAQT